MTFVRIGNAENKGKAWFGAFSRKYKLILSGSDRAGFFDLENDPNELRNSIALLEHREKIRFLARALKKYGQKHKDPLMELNAIRSDLEWAIEGTGPYGPAPR